MAGQFPIGGFGTAQDAGQDGQGESGAGRQQGRAGKLKMVVLELVKRAGQDRTGRARAPQQGLAGQCRARASRSSQPFGTG